MASMRLTLGLLLGLVAGCSADHPEQSAATATGRWLTASGNLEVDIAPCGQALCGTVARVIANKAMSPDAAPPPETDAPAALGLKILSDFAPRGVGQWSGTIYNRQNGKTYDCLMTVLAADQLKVRPYVVLPLFGQTQIWTRVSH